MNGIRPLYFFRRFDRWNVEIHYDRFLAAPHQYAFKRFIWTGIYLLMGDIRGDVNKVSGTCHGGELQMISPPHTSAALYNKDHAFELAVMMRSGLGIRMNADRSGPELRCAGSSVGDGGSSIH